MNKEKKIEVLSPAGDMESLKAAVAFGADAVYLGGQQFGMRAAPANFDETGMRQAVEHCHENHVRVYVVCNTLPRNEELEMLPAFMQDCQAAGADALILSDMGALFLAKDHVPEMELHVSTQAGIVNYAAANALYQLGARRVVLARELSMEEIGEIRAKVPEDLEIEAFVHGAMCMSFSGRCLLSNYMTGRDANRGGCAQPCRWEYEVTEKQRPGQPYTVVQEEGGSFIFNARDLNMIAHIPELVKAGITSLKIEGRAKSAYYVASTTWAYRRAVDFYLANPDAKLLAEILQEPEKISHRPYSTGFFFGKEPGQSVQSGGYIRDYEVVAVCLGTENGMVKLKQRNRFFAGELADVLQPKGEILSLPMEELYDAYGNSITVAPHAEMIVYLKTGAAVEPGSYFRIFRGEPSG